jgi:putative transposase
LLIQICEAEDIIIEKGVVSKDHVHMHINYRTFQSIKRYCEEIKSTNIKEIATGVSRVEETILGSTFLGNRFWQLEFRKYY